MTAPEEQQGRPALPEQRSGRHAAPRTPVRVRLRGRALAMAAVPTALLMAAAYTPNAAVAETAAGKPCATAPDAGPIIAETPVPKSELPPPLPGPSVPLPATPTAAPTSTPTTPTTPTTVPPAPAPATQAPAPASTPASAPVRSATTGSGSGGVVQAGLIDDIVGGITNLIHPSASPSPSASATTASPSASAPAAGDRAVAPLAAPAAPAPSSAATTPPAAPAGAPSPAASAAPSGKATATAKPSASAKATGSATPSASSTATPSASATPSKDPNCLVPLKGLAAGDSADNPILVPDQNWTLQTSRLTLNHAVLMGVVKVQTPTTTKRVLKFVVESVDIENLDMSTLEGNGKTFHVKGAPGSVSTMRKGPITMYVERMSGHLSQVLGIPIPIDLGELTLTPDGPLPQWLYDLIGKLEIPLWMQMTNVTAIQSGQFGGTLKIPGMQLYNDDKPYVGNR
ncbi:hypothetical protein ACFVHB_05380 [Kitasatospora sp. NPDC127111]|uniref:hypothetical protein n=1 Tax=Kitasatospora sp. NPDC127111 TaxID=3345363 RepID=UPI003631F13B